jgi:Domain of unknown function (DUF1844)
MSTDSSSDEPRIIVDDDWKSRVAAEKAAERAAARRAARQAGAGDTGSEPSFPPASFELLLTTYSTQALVALGIYPDPATGQPAPNRDLAKLAIDMLAVIEQVTKGNLTADQAAMLESMLHQLRMLFVNIPATKASPAEPLEAKKSVLELP